MKPKKILAAGFLVIILIGLYVLKLFWDAGTFKTIRNVNFAECAIVSPVDGPEDIAILEGTHFAIVSSHNRDEHHPQPGHIFLYDFIERKTISIPVTGLPKDFYPHGLDALVVESRFVIAVINQNSIEETRVEFFEFDPNTRDLKWIRSITGHELLAANDLVLLSNDEFLFTRDFDTKEPFKVMIQQYARQATGSIWHYQNNTFKKKASGLFYANGIAFDKSTSTVYAAEMAGRKVHSFKWDHSELLPENKIESPHPIDNLTLSEDSVIGAGHPKLLALKKMRDNHKYKAPSTVVEFSKDLKSYNIIYENDGGEIAASSVAMPVSPNEILVGSVFDNHFLHCKRNTY